MTKIYEVRSISRHNDKPHTWGADYSYDDAERRMGQRFGGDNKEWAEKHHQRWWIEEIDTSRAFKFPSLPAPRDRFSVREHVVESEEGYWNSLKIDILDQSGKTVAGYERNYPRLMQTFEPFRQGDRMFALISTDYTATSVMDLATGKVIASETPESNGFCPVGFYVPDWWDVNEGSILPGSSSWKDDFEYPKGEFGFVWGCIWGDDTSWKIQFLDLSKIQDGEILREERFGYVKLAADANVHPKEFIRCSFSDGKCTVRLKTEDNFDLESGKLIDDYE